MHPLCVACLPLHTHSVNAAAACNITGATASAGTIACNGGTTTLTVTATTSGATGTLEYSAMSRCLHHGRRGRPCVRQKKRTQLLRRSDSNFRPLQTESERHAMDLLLV